MDSMNTDLQALIQSYFDCGWEEFETDPQVKITITEMKGLADMYLKTKSSPGPNSTVTGIALEAELKRLKAELTDRVETLKNEKESEITEEEEEEEEQIEKVEVRTVKVKSKTDKLPLIALVTSVIAIVLSALSLFWSSQNSLSREDFETYKLESRQSVTKTVSDANQLDRNDIGNMQGSLLSMRQELEASKQEVSALKLEMFEKLATQASEFNLKIASLLSSLKKSPPKPLAKPKPTAPAPKAKTAPAKTLKKRL